MNQGIWDHQDHPGLWFQTSYPTGCPEAAQRGTLLLLPHLNLHWPAEVEHYFVFISRILTRISCATRKFACSTEKYWYIILNIYLACKTQNLILRKSKLYPISVILLWQNIKLPITSSNMLSCTYTSFPLGGGGVVWTKLQEVLSSVEDSISCKRSWAAPITASDRVKHQEHLRAAQESSAKATQVLKRSHSHVMMYLNCCCYSCKFQRKLRSNLRTNFAKSTCSIIGFSYF